MEREGDPPTLEEFAEILGGHNEADFVILNRMTILDNIAKWLVGPRDPQQIKIGGPSLREVIDFTSAATYLQGDGGLICLNISVAVFHWITLGSVSEECSHEYPEQAKPKYQRLRKGEIIADRVGKITCRRPCKY